MQRDHNGSWNDPGTDDELEVSSLDGPAGTSGPRAPDRDAAGSGRADATFADAHGGPIPGRSNPRRRRIATATSIGAIVLALIVLLGGTGAGGVLFQGLFPAPTPTATLPPFADGVYLVHTIPWGVLHLDGHPATVPTSDSAAVNGYPFLQLSRGRHTLEYAADPFAPVRCTISVPAAASDTCPDDSRSTQASGRSFTYRAIDLHASPADLAPDQFAALARAVQAALVFPGGDISAGDHYIRADGSTAAASSARHANLVVSLNTASTGSGQYIVNGDPCDTLCSPGAGGFAPPGSAPAWTIMANVHAVWQLTDDTGRLVDTSPVSDANPGSSPDTPFFIDMDVGWNGAWSAEVSGVDVMPARLCAIGSNRLSSLFAQGGQSTQVLSFNSNASSTLSGGCLLSVALQQVGLPAPATPFPPTTLGAVLVRFGAVMAANDAAHKAWPQLPLPSAHEQTIIFSLADMAQS